MNALVGITHDAKMVVDRMRRRLGEPIRLIAEDAFGRAICVVGETNAVLATAETDAVAVAVLGSDVKLRGSARAIAEIVSVADGATDILSLGDLVGVALNRKSGDLTVVSGSGSHRLYSARDGSTAGTVVASSLRVAASSITRPSVDRSYEDFLLGFGFVPAPNTVIAGVRELAPGSIDILNGTSQISRPLRASNQVGPNRPQSNRLVDVLQEVVADAASSAREHALLLGGFDSALVAALLRNAGKDVVAYTFRFADESMNQRNIDVVVETLGIRHRWVDITPDVVGHYLDRLPQYLNGPSAQPHYQIHTVAASRQIRRDGFELVFTGDGCDAVFLGYPTINQRSRIGQRLRKLPPPALKMLLRLLGTHGFERLAGHAARAARSAVRSSLLPWPASGHLPTQYLDELTIRRLRSDHPMQAETIEATRIRLAEGLDALDPARLAFNGNGVTAASRMKVDGAVASAGLAHWTPYTHPVVKAIAGGLDIERLRPSGSAARAIGKAALVEEVLDTGLLPRDVVIQPKQSPATSPIDDWYRGALRPTVDRLVEALPFDIHRPALAEIIVPKQAEEFYRRRVTLSRHTLQAIGILTSYGAFSRLSSSR